MIDGNRILLGLLISSIIGAVAYRRGSLSRSGWLGAIITGTMIFGAGGWPHGITLVFFFVSSTLLSRWRTAYKATLERHVFEKGSQRGKPSPTLALPSADACSLVCSPPMQSSGTCSLPEQWRPWRPTHGPPSSAYWPKLPHA